MKKIGNFFAKIGQGIKKGFLGLISWIKNTAWIQPLLIVGLIFGVILSIKPFISWVGGVLNPDENYRFLISKKDKNRDIVSKFEIVDNENDAQGKKTRTVKLDGYENTDHVMVIFYKSNESISNYLQQILSDVSASSGNYTWISVDLYFGDDDDADEQEKEFYKNFDEVVTTLNDFYTENLYYENSPYKMFSDTLSLYGDDNKTNIPSPTFVRFDKGMLAGLASYTFSSASNDQTKKFEQFALGTTDKENGDWTKTNEEYIKENN